jgi:hypothetical protein
MPRTYPRDVVLEQGLSLVAGEQVPVLVVGDLDRRVAYRLAERVRVDPGRDRPGCVEVPALVQRRSVEVLDAVPPSSARFCNADGLNGLTPWPNRRLSRRPVRRRWARSSAPRVAVIGTFLTPYLLFGVPNVCEVGS